MITCNRSQIPGTDHGQARIRHSVKRSARPDDQSRIVERETQRQNAAVDAALVERVRRADSAALADLYDRHATTVYSIALSILRDPSRAEDVTHDVFLRLWNAPDRFDPAVGRFAPWFYRVARNRSIDVVRRQRFEFVPSESTRFDLTPDADPDPSDQAISSTESQRVRRALSSLPENQRQLIELAYFGGLSHRQLAGQLDLPLGTVKTRIRLGLRRLREMMQQEEEGE